MTLSQNHPMMDGRTADSPLISAYRGKTPSRRPVWFMRQAGRSLPEYRELREGTQMLDACLRPELAPRSPCSRCAATASTPASSSATSSCR